MELEEKDLDNSSINGGMVSVDNKMEKWNRKVSLFLLHIHISH